MKQSLQFILIMLASLGFFSCNMDKCLEGAGKTSTQTFLLDTFNHIHIYGVFEIELVNEEGYSIQATCGQNIMSSLEFDVKGDTLSLYNNVACSNFKSYQKPKLLIAFPELKKIEIKEACKIVSDSLVLHDLLVASMGLFAEVDLNIEVHKLYFYNHKSTGGIYNFSGSAKHAYFYPHYTAFIQASDLEASNLTVGQHSIANCQFWAVEKMNVGIYNTGDLLYKGSPEVIVDTIASSGEIIPFD